jgi:hypothetical protein
MIKIDQNISESWQIVRKNNFNDIVFVVLFYKLFINTQLGVKLTVTQIVNEYKIYVYIFRKNAIS